MAFAGTITIKDIYKSFGRHKVLKGVNLEINPDQITVILGQSGQGKSVLLKIIIGLIPPDSGQVLFDGVDLSKLGPREKFRWAKRFGMLFQGAALFDSMNVFDNVAFPLREHCDLTEEEVREKVEKILSDVGLPGIFKKMPSQLSGGMKKRVGLARALILEPQIMFYDEPTTGLDPLLTDSVDNLIMETQRRLKITSVVVSHDIYGTFRVADKVALLHEGRILEEGPPEEFRKSKKPFVQQFLAGKAARGFIG